VFNLQVFRYSVLTLLFCVNTCKHFYASCFFDIYDRFSENLSYCIISETFEQEIIIIIIVNVLQ